jgi:hypothetical protein
MWSHVGICAAAVGIGMLEGTPLWKARKKKECIVFGMLLLSGTALSLAQAMYVPLPNPLEWVCKILRPYSDTLNYILS